MCGIAGICNLEQEELVTEIQLRQMLGAIRHRGPDQFGILLDEGIGLASARLAIIDPDHGQQPIRNEDGSLWIVFNGEIFNYPELRSDLIARGHHFETGTDTEVFLHHFEEFGPVGLQRLNGQFAVAIWNARSRTLFLARDRLGIRPLYYTTSGGGLVFASEIKAILATGRVAASIDPVALDQIFTYWGAIPPRTFFQDIRELPPGHWLQANADQVVSQRYWQLQFGASPASGEADQVPLQEHIEQLREHLTDAVRLRLRADVPVAAYLSGGLDSAVVAALACTTAPARLHTFSISFSEPAFDESAYQRRMAQYLGTTHEVVETTGSDIARHLPRVTWHCETPILRTSPVPMFLLSKRLQQRGFKVALTGEGADETFGGYDIFKEAKIRHFWAAQPNSRLRPLLLQRLYPDIAAFQHIGSPFLQAFFQRDLTEVGWPFYSHAIRWRNGARQRRFYSKNLLSALGRVPRDLGAELELPAQFARWDVLQRAQYLEFTTFLSQYLLCAQGDRMGMAHAVEGRFPFLDFRVVEFGAQLPSRLKLRSLNEKYLLRCLAGSFLPPEIACRRKRPYRAPIRCAFFAGKSEDYVLELLSADHLRACGLFEPPAVAALIGKLQSAQHASESEEMAFMGILSAQLLYHQYVEDFQPPPPLADSEPIKLCAASDQELMVELAS